MPSITTQLRFTHAFNIVRASPINSSLHAADKLQLYGLYKQATEGDINIPRPSSRQVVEYAKWKAWNRMKGFGPMEAQTLYLESLIQILTELIHRYPKHEHATFISQALDSLTHYPEEELILSPSSSTPQSSYYHSSNNYPITPMTSPGKWVHHKDDILSEPDTIDREVAAATANLSLSSPRHSPYRPRKSTTSSSSSNKKQKSSDRALEKLQTEVSALTEQVDRLRASLQQQNKAPSWRIFKLLIKHFLANSAILCIVLCVVYKKQSLDYITPIIQAMMRALLHKVVFWKV